MTQKERLGHSINYFAFIDTKTFFLMIFVKKPNKFNVFA